MGAGVCGRVIDQACWSRTWSACEPPIRPSGGTVPSGLLGGWIGHDKRLDSASGKESRVAQGIGAVGELGDGNHVGGIGGVVMM